MLGLDAISTICFVVDVVIVAVVVVVVVVVDVVVPLGYRIIEGPPLAAGAWSGALIGSCGRDGPPGMDLSLEKRILFQFFILEFGIIFFLQRP